MTITLERKKWITILNSFRRKGGNDSFTVTDSTRVCEFHFKPEEIRISSGIGRKTLVPGSVPTIFKFKEKPPVKHRKPPAKRERSPVEESTESEYEESDPEETYEANMNFADFLDLHAGPSNTSDDDYSGPADYLDVGFC